MILVDTGPLVALFDPRDAQHSRCREVLRTPQESLYTTVAVLTEALAVGSGTDSAMRRKENSMALDARKRQQKLAKKAAKRKAALATKKSAWTAGGVVPHGRHAVSAASGPIHECLIPDSLFDIGIGNVIVSRKMPNGFISAAVFLVDIFCLGIKDAFYDVLSPVEYDYRMSGLQHETFRAIHPTCARKLVEGAEAYARDLGFPPHPDYQRARQIFGDLDATTCPTQYTFGKDGKPFFMSGPYDTPAKCRRIIDTLTRRCGPKGFHFTVGGEALLE